MNKLYTFFFAFQFLALVNVYAQQEICNNGKDDDGDGFIDCFDPECSGSEYCEDFFMGEEANCEAKPTEFPLFSLKKAGASADKTASTLSRVSVGDLDRDGTPEIVVTNRLAKTMNILSGKAIDGKLKSLQEISLFYEPEHGVALGDVDRNGYAEIFVSGRDRTIQAYKMDPATKKYSLLWQFDSKGDNTHEKGRPVVLGLADFNEDGKPELYYKNEIRDALTGLRLVNGVGNWEQTVAFGTVAVDILEDSECTDCQGLELVAGGVIYSVSIGNGTKDNGKLTERKRIPNYSTRNAGENWSSASVADYNLDGNLDVLASGASGSPAGATTVFFWDVKNNVIRSFKPINNANGTGRLNISDIDGDGKMNTTFVSGNKLYALDENFELKWEKGITEVSSGFTGTTVFDFNGDGAFETVYRDEKFLYIINGINGVAHQTIPCKSRTSSEYPVVADVDGDGATEICLVCNTDDGIDETNFDNNIFGQVRVYKSDGENWVPSRKVWNQHTYFNVNINDDLTIPQEMQKHYIPFGDGNCEGKTGINRPLNTFLNQSPRLDINGCPTYGAADFTITDNSIKVTPPTCPGEEFTVSFTIINQGDITVTGNLPVTFYQEDPFKAGSLRLNTINISIQNMKPGDTFEAKDLLVKGTGAEFTLFISVNDLGTGTPPLTAIVGSILECDNNNNLASAHIKPNPFLITVVKEKNHFECTASSDVVAKPNGVARAFVPIDGAEVTAGYTFYWYKDTDLSVAPIDTGAIQTGLSNGLYTVQAVHDEAQCKSTTQQTVTIGTETPSYSLSIVVNRNKKTCDDSSQQKELWGELEAIVKDASGKILTEGDFSFEWYRQGYRYDPDYLVANGAVASWLHAETYDLVFTDNLTGCSLIASKAVEKEITTPTLSLAVSKHITRCDLLNDGALLATIDADQNLKINWYKGNTVDKNNLIPNVSGPDLSGLPAGDYTAQVQNTYTGCLSEPAYATIDSKISLPVITPAITHNSGCEEQKWNGKISISIATPTPGITPEDYDVKWYEGTGTTGNLVASSKIDGKGLKNLGKGQYTATVINKDSKCQEEVTYTVLDKPKNYEVYNGIKGNTVCLEDNTIKYTGQIKISLKADGNDVTGDELNNYTFTWKDANGTPISTTTGAILDKYPHGNYTLSIKDNETGCDVGSQQTFTIPNNTVIPTIKLSPIIAATTCTGTPNGILEATILTNGQPLTSGYSLKWYDASGTEIPAAQLEGNKAKNLAGGTSYKASVKLDGSNCSYEILGIYLPDASQKPVLSRISKSDNTICDVTTAASGKNNGAISFSLTYDGAPVTLPNANYTIKWFELAANGNETLLSYTGLSADDLKEGRYRVVVERTDLGCTSNSITTTIAKTPLVAEPVITVVPQTSCDENNPNGSLSVKMQDAQKNPLADNDFTFTWYEIDANGNEVEIGTGLSVSQLKAGNYSVKAMGNATGCLYTAPKNVPDKAVNPVVSLATTPIPDCETKGSITATINGGDVADYTFTWYDATNTEISGVNGNVLTAWAGDYYVIAEHKTLKCRSQQKKATILPPAAPFFAIEYKNEILPSSCQDDDGKISAWVNDGTHNTTDYTFTWYKGRALNPPSTFYTNEQVLFNEPALLVGSNELSGLVTGVYTVVAEHKVSHCKEFIEIDLPYIDAHVVKLASTVTGESTCDPVNHDGKISVQIDPATLPNANDPTLPQYDQTHYHYYLFRGSNPADDLSGAIDDKRSQNPNAGIEFENLEAGFYSIIAIEKISNNNCQSVSITLEVPQLATPPVVDLHTVVNNSQCAEANGSITFSADKGTDDKTTSDTDYSYRVLNKADNSVAVDFQNVPLTGTGLPRTTDLTLAGIPTGKYYLEVKGESTDCQAALVPFEILYAPVKPTLSVADFTVTHQTYCSPVNGTITLNNVGFENETTFDPAKYKFSWSKNNAALSPDPGSVTSLSDLEAGTYKVLVTRTAPGPGYGCSVEKEITVNYEENELDIEFTPVHNTNCLTGAPNGKLTATINHLSANSTYEWFKGQTSSSGTLQNQGLNLNEHSGLSSGWYTLKVTDAITGCSYEDSYEIKDTPVKPSITALDKSNQTECNDNGSIWVETIEFNNVIYTTAPLANWLNEFTFTWYDGDGTPLPGQNSYELTGIAAGTYTVEVTRTSDIGQSCKSASASETITFQDPGLKVTFSPTNNTACDLTFANGSIIAAASYADGRTPGILTFTWKDENGNIITGTPNTDGDTEEIAKLEPGTYTLTVTDNIGCSASVSHEIKTEDLDLRIVETTISKQPKTTCKPSGSITIADMSIGNVSQYEFRWYKDSYDESNPLMTDNGSGTQVEISGPVLSSIEAGYYYVKAKRVGQPNLNIAGAGCWTPVIRVKVEEDIIYPEVSLVTDNPVTNCDPASPNGKLGVTPRASLRGADNPSDYTYTWYDKYGIVIYTPVATEINNMPAGPYTLEVKNSVTECSTTYPYIIEEKKVYPILAGSATDVTNCDNPNGKLFANILNVNANNSQRTFAFYWYEGHLTTKPADGSEIGTGRSIEGRAEGPYTVFAVETGVNSLNCNSSSLHLEIKDNKVSPQPNAYMDAAVTNCDPSRPNGQGSVNVNGDYFNYTFIWRNAAGNVVSDNVIASKLAAGTYTVEATSNSTGCKGSTQITIADSPVAIVMNEADVEITNRTNCSISNGMLQASVGGETNGYTFYWFTGSNTSAQNLIPNENNPVLSGLAGGTYTVYAVWNKTGCASNAITKVVNEVFNMPEMNIITSPAVCGEENGLASLQDLKGNIATISWNLGYEIIENVYQVNAPAGSYSVTVTSYEGCSTTQDFEVPVEIKVFNGITDNNDGENDFFTIDCIENFGSNNVKIFNRAGTLVYEMNGYNSSDKTFNGKGNKGLYLQGNKLPAGTYFYIIDKRNGSKPTSGYLELIR